MSTAPEPIRPIRHLHRHRRVYQKSSSGPWAPIGWIILGGLIVLGCCLFLFFGGLGVLVLAAMGR